MRWGLGNGVVMYMPPGFLVLGGHVPLELLDQILGLGVRVSVGSRFQDRGFAKRLGSTSMYAAGCGVGLQLAVM